jgi:hypothetical protein
MVNDPRELSFTYNWLYHHHHPVKSAPPKHPRELALNPADLPSPQLNRHQNARTTMQVAAVWSAAGHAGPIHVGYVRRHRGTGGQILGVADLRKSYTRIAYRILWDPFFIFLLFSTTEGNWL